MKRLKKILRFIITFISIIIGGILLAVLISWLAVFTVGQIILVVFVIAGISMMAYQISRSTRGK